MFVVEDQASDARGGGGAARNFRGADPLPLWRKLTLSVMSGDEDRCEEPSPLVGAADSEGHAGLHFVVIWSF